MSYYFDVLKVLFVSTVAGFGCLLVFDTLGVLIELLKSKYKVVLKFFNDMLCVLSHCFLLILIFYYSNSGAFKGMFFIGVCFGGVLYYYLFRQPFHRILNIILIPIKFIVTVVYRTIRKIFIFFAYAIEKIELKLYNKIDDSQY
jgi:hypothetical protein